MSRRLRGLGYEPDYEEMQRARDNGRAERALHRMDNQMGRVEDWRTACVMVDGCPNPATYMVKMEVVDDEFPVCVEHTAELRANDPLDYIVSVRTILGRESA